METCKCGARVKYPDHPWHVGGKRHRAWEDAQEPQAAPVTTLEPPVYGEDVVKVVVEATNNLDPDLAAILTERDPRLAAKMTRFAFSARGWPSGEHPGTVRDFLMEHAIKIMPRVR